MSLTFHQFRKDLRQFRIILPIWFLMLFLDLATNLGWLGGGLSADWEKGRSASHDFMAFWQTFFLWALFLVIPSAVVLADSPGRREGFLRTRPLPGRALFLAKALFVGGLVILPVLLQEALYLSLSGLSPGYVAHGVAERFLYALPFVATAAAFASFWRSYATWGSGLAIAFGGMCILTIGVEIACDVAGAPNPFISSSSVSHSSQNLAALYALGISAVFLAVAHARSAWGLRPRWVGIASALLIFLLVKRYWPWDFSTVRPADPVAARSLIERSPLDIPLQNILLNQTMGQPDNGLDFDLNIIPKETNALAPNLAEWTCLQSQLINSTQKTFAPSQPPGFSSLGRGYGSGSSADLKSWATMLPADSIFLQGPSFNPGGMISPSLGRFSLNAQAPWLREPVTVKAQMEGRAYRWDQVADLPLTTPGTARDSQGTWSLLWFFPGLKLRNIDQPISVMLQRSQVSFAIAADPRTVALQQGLYDRFEILIFDPRRQIVLLPDNFSYPNATYAGATALVQYVQSVNFTQWDNLRTLFTPQDWAQCRLLIFGRTWLGSVPVAWQSPPFVINDLLTPPSPSRHPAGRDGLSADEVAKRLTELPVPGPQAPRAEVCHYLIQVMPIINAVRNGEKPDDQVASRLAALVPTHLDVLLDGFPVLGYPAQGIVLQAIAKGATDSQKSQIIAALPANSELMEVISQRGWVTSAHDAICQFLDSPKSLSFPIIQAIASFHDAATYPRLLAEFEAQPRRDIYDVLHELPGLADSVAASANRAWQSEDRCIGFNNTTPAQSVLDVAVHVGNRDAFQFACQWLALTSTDSPWCNWELAQLFRANVKPDHGQWDQGESDEQVFAWMRQHKPDSFVFDPQLQKFVLKP